MSKPIGLPLSKRSDIRSCFSATLLDQMVHLSIVSPERCDKRVPNTHRSFAAIETWAEDTLNRRFAYVYLAALSEGGLPVRIREISEILSSLIDFS
jgi:hypothetical protein